VRTTTVGAGTAALAVDERRGRVVALALDPGDALSLDPGLDEQATQSTGPTSALDAATGRLVRTLPGVSGVALAINARDGRLLVASNGGCPPANDYNSACLGVFDEITGRRVSTHPLPLTVDLRAMVSDDVTGHAFAMLLDDRTAGDSRGFDHLIALNAKTGAPLRDNVLQSSETTAGAFVTSATAGRVALVTVPNGYKIQDDGGGPAQISVAETRGGRVLNMEGLDGGTAGTYGFRTSAVIDARRGRIVVLVQPLADLAGHLGGPAVFNVLDARTGRLLHTAPGQAGDVALGLDAVRGHLFVANARTNSVRMLDTLHL